VTFTETSIPGVLIARGNSIADERGTLEVAWEQDALARHGLDTRVAQCNVATNRRRGTIRGLHYQTSPYEEVKVIRLVRGAVFDVAVDLRPDSRTFRRWVGVELDAASHQMLYVPQGCAHGYQTLTDDTEVFYLVSAPYSPPSQRGVRWNDPAFSIAWPLGSPTVINHRDATYPDFT
jgi:dTDP-4-dehydrorhamnose 3,5-epimerase